MSTVIHESKTSARLRQQAETLAARIADLRQPRNENTPKRQREGMARRCEAENLEQTRRALETLAEAHEEGAPMVEWVAALRNRSEVEPLVSRVWDTSGGYYSVGLSDKYRDDSHTAQKFRDWLKNRAAGKYDQQDAEAARAAKVQALIEKVRFANIPGFFPTPDDLARQVVALAEIEPGMLVLEPSAGIGNLADAARDLGARVLCVEINHDLCDILKGKGHTVAVDDFLSTSLSTIYDRIVMNPPFERGQDADHVRHAYRFLKPGGRLVAIVSPGFQMSRGQAFADWLEEVGAAVRMNPEGSFKSSFCPTGVRTFTVIIDKP